MKILSHSFLLVIVISFIASCQSNEQVETKKASFIDAQQTIVDSAKTLFQSGVKVYNAGNYQRALHEWTRAATLFNRAGKFANEGIVYFNLGEVHEKLQEPDLALQSFYQALNAFQKEADPENETWTYYRLGKLHLALSHPDSALANLGHALQLLEQKYKDLKLEASVCDEIGRTYDKLDRLDLATAWLTKAMKTYVEAGDNLGKASAYFALQVVKNKRVSKLIDAGKTDSALAVTREILDESTLTSRMLLEAFQESKKLLGDRSPLASEATPAELEALRNVTGLEELTFQITRLASSRLKSPRDEALSLLYIGQSYARLNLFGRASAYYDSARQIQQRIGDRIGESETLRSLAKHYHRQIYPPRLNLALAYYDSAHTMQSQVLAHAGDDPSRLSLAERDFSLYGEWVLAEMAMSPRIGIKKAALAALAVSELGRGQALRDLLRSAPARIAPGIDLIKAGTLLTEVNRTNQSTVLDYMVSADTLVIWVILPTGDVRVFRQGLASQSMVREVQDVEPEVRSGALRLNARTALAEQVAALRAQIGVDDYSSLRALFASSSTRALLLLERDVSNSLQNDQRNVQPIIPTKASNSTLRQMAKIVLPTSVLELLPASGELIIVPHGPLNLLPFAALPIGETDEPLGARYALRYSPSVTILTEVSGSRTVTTNSTAKSKFDKALIVGNPNMPIVKTSEGQQISLQPLPGAEREGRWIAGQLNVQPLSGAAASEYNVLQRIAPAPLIHFATHGYAYASEVRTRDSFIALAPGQGQDGLLTVGEVIDRLPKLSADLVVLSACQTGLGNISEAEGTIGLQRAFLAKGARSVLVSLWSVSDATTEKLMQAFYRHWLDDTDHPSKAEALRRSQNDIREISGFEAPRYWAAFQLVGGI